MPNTGSLPDASRRSMPGQGLDTFSIAAQIFSNGTEAKPPALSGMRRIPASFAARRRAIGSGRTIEPWPLWTIARLNNPVASDEAIRLAIAIAPADSPNTVTFSGAPPKLAMLARTHSSAAIMSRKPRFVGTPAIARKPSMPRR